jgi:hypothetical protein
VPSARERNTSHHFAAKPQYITVCEANGITCARAQTSQFQKQTFDNPQTAQISGIAGSFLRLWIEKNICFE